MPEGGAILLTVGLVDLAHGVERAVFGLDLALHGGHGQLQLLLVLAGDADDFRDELMIAYRKIGAFIVFQQILDPLSVSLGPPILPRTLSISDLLKGTGEF